MPFHLIARLVVHVINFDLIERPRSPTSWRSRGSDRPTLRDLATEFMKRTTSCLNTLFCQAEFFVKGNGWINTPAGILNEHHDYLQ